MHLLFMLWKDGRQGRAAHMGKTQPQAHTHANNVFRTVPGMATRTDRCARTRMLCALQVVPDAVAATTTETTKAEAEAHTQAHNEEMNNKAGAAEVDS